MWEGSLTFRHRVCMPVLQGTNGKRGDYISTAVSYGEDWDLRATPKGGEAEERGSPAAKYATQTSLDLASQPHGIAQSLFQEILY